MIGTTSVDLQTAATKLGVHYQTAYRWIRTGRLPAVLIEGRYLINSGALADFDRDRRKPRPPSPPSAARIAHNAEAVHVALLNGDEKMVQTIYRGLIEEGLSRIDLIQEVISPSLRRIGQAWHGGEIDIWVEHRASAIVERALGDVMPNPRGRRRGSVAVAAITGDRHGLPTTMAAVALRSANWNVHHLGADTPPATIHSFLGEHEIDLLVLSNTNPDVTDLTTQTANEVRERPVPVLVGQPGATLTDLVAKAASSTR